jgi:hypothetical protein
MRTLKILLFVFTNRLIAEWQQSASVDYKSFGPYYLSVMEGNVDWSFFLPGWERHYVIYVGRESGDPGYGHYVDFSFHPGDEGLESHVKQSKVEWTEAGVTFNPPSGHALFIPKRMFIGGR